MAGIGRRVSAKGTTTWRVSYYVGPKLHWTPTIYTAEGAVEIKDLIETHGHEYALALMDKRRGARSGAPLLSEVLETYLATLDGHAARGTAPEYRRTAERTWLPVLGPLPVDTVDRESIEQWVASQRGAETARSATARARVREHNRAHPREKRPLPAVVTYSPKSIRNAHAVLSQTLTYAERVMRAIPSNPARGVRLPADSEASEMEIFTKAEFQAFLAAMQPTYRVLTAFLVVTGCRIGEATAVQVRDLDLDVPAVTIRRAWKRGATPADGARYLGSPKSRRGNRTIVLPATLGVLLAALVRERRSDELVFTAERGGPIRPSNYGERQFQRALERAGITKHLTPHSLRHTSASWLLMDGQPPQVVQHRLGHESLDTTSRTYAHLLQEAQVPAAAYMEAAVPLVVEEPAQLGA